MFPVEGTGTRTERRIQGPLERRDVPSVYVCLFKSSYHSHGTQYSPPLVHHFREVFDK